MRLAEPVGAKGTAPWCPAGGNHTVQASKRTWRRADRYAAHPSRPRRAGGSGGADTLIGTMDGETIVSRGGDDVILASGGNDSVNAGTGDDAFMWGSGGGNDVFDGGAGQPVSAEGTLTFRNLERIAFLA